MEDRERHSAAARLLTCARVSLAAALAVPLAVPTQALAGPWDGGSCGSTGKWVVCNADDDTTTPGSGSHHADSASGHTSKPVCTVKKMEPQPPPDSMFWEGKSSKDGAVYQRTCQNGPDGAPISDTFVADTPTGAAPVDPAVVAQQAVAKMKLAGPEIASPRAAGTYIVGVPMWMWVNRGPTTYGPNSASATAGGVTVTATAEVTKIVWRMGDGATVTCNGPGTAYTASYGKQESPTCGHVYARTSVANKGGKYAVAATSTWAVDWQVKGGGVNGEFTETRQSQTQVGIGELQVVR
ncbi:ATP/GTP-binding protein [Streptomyces sp. NPDC048489]|uniref:ATP/GTP-binding protein n=1 Tax=Streptomyces sp. NPDC048489 TaxID=3154504 RepID=UPI00343B822D